MKAMYLFIYLFVYFLNKGNLIPSFFFSFSFLKRWCVFLPSMRTAQLFCVLFSPCVYSRPSTVTYLIFVTVTKVITYSIDVYIYSILSESNVKGGTLCAAHHCLWIVCFIDFFFFLCSVVLILALGSKGVRLM